jgi:5-hmdU DNA kinase-like protein
VELYYCDDDDDLDQPPEPDWDELRDRLRKAEGSDRHCQDEKMNGIDRLLAYIYEREAVRRRRAKGKPPPFSDDPIMRAWRFTNVHREHDRGTQWLRENWRKPYADDPDLWFALTLARVSTNRIETLEALGYPNPWDPDHYLDVAAEFQRRGEKWESAAYMIRADNRKVGRIDNKPLFYAKCVLAPLWRDRRRLRPQVGDTLAEWHSLLGAYTGIGDGFYSAQVVADLKFVRPLRDAKDWWTFVVSGPGSRKGLNYALGRPADMPWRERDWRRELHRLHNEIEPDLKQMGIELCAQGLQHNLCEIAKYEHIRLGGKGKRRFRR